MKDNHLEEILHTMKKSISEANEVAFLKGMDNLQIHFETMDEKSRLEAQTKTFPLLEEMKNKLEQQRKVVEDFLENGNSKRAANEKYSKY